ncbi:ATP-binding cassette domain-containing protein [Methylophilus medardicus]|uniref:Probable ATP-binding protein YheS n=1 Tax=Methylophilus medardicus TaxID=2588534 RepID=A0A5B8CT46_9PROT|nr:ATP-binding cassette domain-containing protein [Methylophilus medardicus]QDC49450.1 ATP-binding cassette domain-containing protein [Methylophilus medardicus]QDC53155.1 ATP-binding cassette domain-containing protein [Methylophilus medardicus]
MSVIQFKQLTFSRAGKTLVEAASFQLHPGHRVGLTGANGAGKSTLFALLRGELTPDVGELLMPPQWVIAHVAQETPALAQSALDYTLDGDEELRTLQLHLAQAEAGADIDPLQLADWHQRLADIEGYSAQSRASALLAGLGFSQAQLSKPVSDFSGGWRMRLNLARALMCRSDLLLLDEPTNHLDIEAVIWLEGWLSAYRGTLLLISHDREFLDNTVNHILHIEQQQLTLYRGGYSDFERQRAEKLTLQQASYQKQQLQMAHLQKYIDRFRAQATKARQAQSRIKALERMERISAAHVDSPFTFGFRALGSSPDPLLVMNQMALGYSGQTLVKLGHLAIRPGERIGLLGKNGAGKSTLIKALAQSETLLAGERVEGKDLRIGYFAQHQLEQLVASDSPLQHLQRLDSQTREQELLDFLGGFDFRGEMAKSPCGPFSGGEKSRLALAMLIWQRPNLILLDEPTNHLDIEMRHALSMALQAYEGGMVMVSHDRTLLATCCEKFVLVADGQATVFDGDLDDYKQVLLNAPAGNASSEPVAAKQNSYHQQKADRQARLVERRPLVKAISALEAQMATLEQEKRALDNQLADSAVYEAAQRELLQSLLKAQGENQKQLALIEGQWLDAQEQLEMLPEIE